MSTLPQQTTINQYLADGVAVDYTYNFLILLPGDMNVYVTLPGNSANPAVDFVDQSNYTISNVGDINGGTVTFLVAPVSGAIVTILRNMQLSISTAFSNAQNFNGANLDAAFQRVVLLIQQMQGNAEVNASEVNPTGVNGAITRCLQYAIDTYLPTTSPTTMPSLLELNGVPTDGLVWVGQGGGITVTQLFTGGDANALKILLASEVNGADGASLIGYYDTVNNVPQTVDDFLTNLPTFLNNLNYVTASRLQSGYAVSADDTGAVNAMVVTLSPSLAAYVAYDRLYVKVAVTNTGATTINVNGLGAKAVTYMDGSALVANALQAGAVAELIYDGTQYQLLNPFVRPATSAETLTGTNNYLPITPAALAAAFALGAGTITLPGGLIIKWGSTGSQAPNNNVTVSFPVAFPTACLAITLVPKQGTNVGSANVAVDPTLSAASFVYRNMSGSANAADSFYIALGH